MSKTDPVGEQRVSEAAIRDSITCFERDVNLALNQAATHLKVAIKGLGELLEVREQQQVLSLDDNLQLSADATRYFRERALKAEAELVALRSQSAAATDGKCVHCHADDMFRSAAAAEETRFDDGVDRCVTWMEEQGRWLNGTTSALSRTGQHDIAKANEIKADRYFRDANQMRSLKRLAAPAAAVEEEKL